MTLCAQSNAQRNRPPRASECLRTPRGVRNHSDGSQTLGRGRKNGQSVWRHSCNCEVMNDDMTRAVSLTRLGHGRYEAVNARGGTIEFSTDRGQTFTPVELFLASIAGCSAIDVDFITSKRSEPLRFEVSMTANKVRDEQGNHLVNLAMTFDVAFPDDDGGRTAAGVLPDAIARSHDRLCTVSRTVEIGTPVATFIADDGAGRT